MSLNLVLRCLIKLAFASYAEELLHGTSHMRGIVVVKKAPLTAPFFSL